MKAKVQGGVSPEKSSAASFAKGLRVRRERRVHMYENAASKKKAAVETVAEADGAAEEAEGEEEEEERVRRSRISR